MSTRDKQTNPETPLAVAEAIAEELSNALRSQCTKLSIAGCVRRLKPQVKDFELVLSPRPTVDLFGCDMERTELDPILATFQSGGLLRQHPINPANGPKLKRFLVPYIATDGDNPESKKVWICSEGQKWITLELYLVPADSFGYHLTIRTGPSEVSKLFVTPRSRGGFLPDGYSARNGRIWFRNDPIDLPSEEAFFALCDVELVAPEERYKLIAPNTRKRA